MRPHRRKPTRLPRPWESPGKNTGVGCHFLLQCMKVKSESEVAQSCPSLSNPTDCSLPGSSIHGIFQARVLEWVPLPSPTLCHYRIVKRSNGRWTRGHSFQLAVVICNRESWARSLNSPKWPSLWHLDWYRETTKICVKSSCCYRYGIYWIYNLCTLWIFDIFFVF